MLVNLGILMSGIEWKRHNGVRMSTGMIQTDHVASMTDCVTKCLLSQLCDSINSLMSSLCDSINFWSTDKSCELVKHVDQLTVKSTDIVTDAGWQWWRASFTTVV